MTEGLLRKIETIILTRIGTVVSIVRGVAPSIGWIIVGTMEVDATAAVSAAHPSFALLNDELLHCFLL